MQYINTFLSILDRVICIIQIGRDIPRIPLEAGNKNSTDEAKSTTFVEHLYQGIIWTSYSLYALPSNQQLHLSQGHS